MRISRFFILLVLLPVGFAGAQTSATFDTLLNRLKAYDKLYSQEKVHLHFDKPFYALGDTIWFESYVVNAGNNTPDVKSRILHVELISDKDSICQALQLPVNAGFAPGDLTLSESFKPGLYRIRAYTNWMRNFDAAYFFYKTITIVDPFPDAPAKKTSKTSVKIADTLSQPRESIPLKYDIQFFPESGPLVEGLKSSVAFKAISSTGNSIEISGKIIDEQNNPLLNFTTTHAGMGSFNFTPGKDKSYTAIIKLPDSTTTSIQLPKALTTGYLVTADNTNPDSLFITLLASPELVNKQEMVLMPLSNGKPVFVLKTKFPDSRVNITVPKNRLPGGILQLTLFNSKNEPLAERLVFNSYHEKVILKVSELKETYKKREKTTLSIQAKNAAGQPLVGSFSMAVTNADEIKTNEQTETTLLSNLLLTSDLKGYVENPNYYFIEPSAAKKKSLDNLMLTQGWRRFVWKDIKDGTFPKINYQPEQEIIVSGTVIDSREKAVPDVRVNLLPAQHGNGNIRDTVTGKDGHFTFNLPITLAGNQFILQTRQKEDLVKMGSYSMAPIIPVEMIKSVTANYVKTTLTGYAKAKMLKEVVIKDYTPRNKLRDINSTSANLNGPGNADKVFTSKDMEDWRSLNDLSGKIPGVVVQRGKIKLPAGESEHVAPVLILVDGQGGPGLDDIPIQDIESVEFLKSIQYIGIYGLRGSGGVLLITTKKGSGRITDTTKARNVLPFKLPVYIACEFYSPKYDKPETNSKTIDQRSTIYWKPGIITATNGTANVEYYNNDVPGNYKIVIEGISAVGNLCREVYYYKVE